MKEQLNKILHKFVIFQLKLLNKQSKINLITYIVLGLMEETNKTECKITCGTNYAELKGKFKLKLKHELNK